METRPDALLKKTLEEQRILIQETGEIKYDFLYVAIPVPSLAIRYLLNYEGFPLGCFTMIVGKEASWKSTLAVEIGRWHKEQYGSVILIDTEGGVSPHAKTILGDSLIPVSAYSVEEWQSKLTKIASRLAKRCDDGKITTPTCFIIDSIAGAEANAIADAISEAGHYESKFPTETRLISGYSRHQLSLIGKYPHSLIATNHIREDILSQNEKIPGGSSIRHLAQIILYTKVRKSPMLTKQGYCGELEIIVKKNRRGPQYRSVVAPVTFFSSGGQTAFYIDWNKSTADLLTEGFGIIRDGKDTLIKNIKTVIQVEKKSAGKYGMRYYCKELGITESDPVSAENLCKALENRQDLLLALYEKLGIDQAPFFELGTPYHATLVKARSFVPRKIDQVEHQKDGKE